MPSLFSPRKDKKSAGGRGRARDHVSATLPAVPPKSAAGGSGSRSPPLPSPRSVTAGFKVVGGWRQDLGEFGTFSPAAPAPAVRPSPTPSLLTPPTSPRKPSSPPPLLPPKYSFLPTSIRAHTASSNSIDSFSYSSDDITGLRPYGVLGGIGAKVVLSVEEVGKAIRDVGGELEKRGLTCPLLFSNQALELSQTRVKMLIQTYLDTLSTSSRPKGSPPPVRYDTFIQDLRFAKEYELAWFLRWALSRVARVNEGTREVHRGVLEWEVYEEWRGRERSAQYPLDAFPYLSALVPSEVFHSLLVPLIRLLSRFAAHSHLSGLTPHALSSLFAPLLFDIPTSAPALTSHAAFVRAAAATEHLLLSYIRSCSGGKAGLGLTDLPARLKDWIAGYPSMVASDAELARGQPRRGARVVRCEMASRTVRAYTKDLILNAESWAKDLPTPYSQSWPMWDRVLLKDQTQPNGSKSTRRVTEAEADGRSTRPKFTLDYRRRMAVKESLPVPLSELDPASSLGGNMSYGQARAPQAREARSGMQNSPPRHKHKGSDEGEEGGRWGTLAGKEWSLFEEGGFGVKGDMRSKLQFDLTESAKTSVAEKRQTMDWTEFASPAGGFSRTDPHLAVSLSFAEPLAHSINAWPKEREALQKKLHKSQKEAVPFHYDTSVRVGTESDGRVWIEEAFLDCWADLMMGAGWAEREELTFKEANWVFIEYKAYPSRPEDRGSREPTSDPRTSALCFLLEETVSLDYQMAIANPQQKKTFATIFSPKKRQPQIPSSLPPSLSRRMGPNGEIDFDRMLGNRAQTKRITLSRVNDPAMATSDRAKPLLAVPPKASSPQAVLSERKRTKSSNHIHMPQINQDNGAEASTPGQGEGKTPSSSFFSKTRSVRRIKTNEENRARAKRERQQQQERESELEFELHSASGLSSGNGSPQDGIPPTPAKTSDEKWMDILIANGAKRMERQDGPPPLPRTPNGLIGLPPSPRPPADHPNTLLHSHPYHTPDNSGDRSTSSLGGSITPATPRASGHDNQLRSISPVASEGTGVERKYSLRERNLEKEYDYEDEPPTPPAHPATPNRDENSDFGREVSASASASPGRSHRELSIIAPTPRYGRDTIHNIVDAYEARDSTISMEEGYIAEPGVGPRVQPLPLPLGKAFPVSGTGGVDVGNHGQYLQVPDPSSPEVEELNSPLSDESRLSLSSQDAAGEFQRDSLPPPAPIFDLTPGREPSPARYKHGGLLHFVYEEDEDEEQTF